MKKYLMTALIVFISTFGLVLNSFAEEKPRYGGILRIITPNSPRVLGYMPEMGPGDYGGNSPGWEAFMNYNSKRELEPVLTESVDIDENKSTITFNLRKGVKFHDGTELNAEAAAWNLQLLMDTKKLMWPDKIRSIAIIDNYTIRLNLTDYKNKLVLHAWGWVPLFSKVAYDSNGKEWCRTNPVVTGPFKLVEWKRDNYIKWERNKDYWQKGKPYLDGIEYRIIPDSVTASAIMQAKEADIWLEPPVKDQAELEKKGLKRQSYWPGLPQVIYLNTKNSKALTGKLKVREAIEYALNKPAIAKALGFGYYTPLTMVAPKGEWGYDPEYKGRPYNLNKARKLLTEAGYPNGLTLKLLCLPQAGGRNTVADAIKAFLHEAGINVDIDIADPGRFFTSLFINGWEDMALFMTATDANFLMTFQRWFSHDPGSNLASFERPPELIALSKESLGYSDIANQKAITKKLIRMIADQALMIPIFYQPAAYMIQDYVHTDYLNQGLVRWIMHDIWMDKH